MYLISAWIYFKPALPGVAAVVLGGIAAVMTFREMHHTHRILFTISIGVLIWLEFRDIRIDRTESDLKGLSDRSAQEHQFQTIRSKQDEEFKQTAAGLNAAKMVLTPHFNPPRKRFSRRDRAQYSIL